MQARRIYTLDERVGVVLCTPRMHRCDYAMWDYGGCKQGLRLEFNMSLGLLALSNCFFSRLSALIDTLTQSAETFISDWVECFTLDPQCHISFVKDQFNVASAAHETCSIRFIKALRPVPPIQIDEYIYK